MTGLCLFVTSTFGNGDPPKMAERLSTWLEEKLTHRDVMVSKRVTFSPFEDEVFFPNPNTNGYGTKIPFFLSKFFFSDCNQMKLRCHIKIEISRSGYFTKT